MSSYLIIAMSTPTSVSEALRNGYTAVEYDEARDKIVLHKDNGLLSTKEISLPRKDRTKQEARNLVGQ